MIPPHDPNLYHNHGEEIQAALEWRTALRASEALERCRQRERANARDRRIAEYRKAADQVLTILVWVLMAAAAIAMVFALFQFAIEQAEAMPRFIEGFE